MGNWKDAGHIDRLNIERALSHAVFRSEVAGLVSSLVFCAEAAEPVPSPLDASTTDTAPVPASPLPSGVRSIEVESGTHSIVESIASLS